MIGNFFKSTFGTQEN